MQNQHLQRKQLFSSLADMSGRSTWTHSKATGRHLWGDKGWGKRVSSSAECDTMRVTKRPSARHQQKSWAGCGDPSRWLHAAPSFLKSCVFTPLAGLGLAAHAQALLRRSANNSLETTLHSCWDALLPASAFLGLENCTRLFAAGLMLFTERWVCRCPWPGTTWW